VIELAGEGLTMMAAMALLELWSRARYSWVVSWASSNHFQMTATSDRSNGREIPAFRICALILLELVQKLCNHILYIWVHQFIWT